MRLATPSRTSAVLRKFGWRFIRDLGQNFLVDENILEKILAAADLGPDDLVLEIGTGIGTLTVELAARAGRVTTVEIDNRLVPILDETLAGLDNVEVRRMDAMDLRPEEAAINGRGPNKMVANLPYNIAAPVLLKCFRELDTLNSAVVMVQKEIADRIMARPGGKNFGAFSLKLKYFCRVAKVATVSRQAFMPPPNVDSTVIKLTRWERPPVDVDREQLFALIAAGFSQRRKQIANAIAGSDLGINKRDVETALVSLGLPPTIRAERLDLADFAKLTEMVMGSG